MPKWREEELRKYIEEKRYIETLERLHHENSKQYPIARVINKKNTDKKRMVFTYDSDENYIMMIMSYLLYEYDSCLMPNVYSFRRDTGVKKAIKTITAHPCIDQMYSYKIDIQDYFNSVSIHLLLPQLQELPQPLPPLQQEPLREQPLPWEQPYENGELPSSWYP